MSPQAAATAASIQKNQMLEMRRRAGAARTRQNGEGTFFKTGGSIPTVRARYVLAVISQTIFRPSPARRHACKAPAVSPAR